MPTDGHAGLDAKLNRFAQRCFRDTADQDYIAARMAYRTHLFGQFHWSALQAMEKYFKAILLLNRIKAKDVKHSLNRAVAKFTELPFEMRLSDSTTDLVEHLERFGRYRYLESSFYIGGPKLVQLDQAAWEIRRYCRALDYTVRLRNGESRNMLRVELDRISDSSTHPPQTFRLQNGLLEKIVASKTHPARAALIWQNAFFGVRRRDKVTMEMPYSATVAPLSMYPDLLEEVRKYVHVPKDVVKSYTEARQSRKT